MASNIYIPIVIVFCFCAAVVVVNSKSIINSVKVWIIFDRTVNAQPWWNTLAQFFQENFDVELTTFRVCKGFDTFVLIGPQQLSCSSENAEMFSNWSTMEFGEKTDVSQMVERKHFYRIPYVVVSK